MRRWRPGRARPDVPLASAAVPAAIPPGGSALGATVPVAPSADGLMPQPLGLETKGGVFTVLITRGTALPTRRSDVFTTADEYQGSITITLFQGDHGQAALNTRLG